MSEHTPRPWTISVRDWEIMIEANGDDVALIQGKTPRDQANARLIAAAPDLYAMLLQVEKVLYEDTNAAEHPCCGWGPLYHEIRAALARARGETS